MLHYQSERSDFAVTFRSSLYSKRARERRYHKICHLTGLRPEDRVLDVGCGEGRSFEEFNSANEIVGLDLNPAREIFQENFRFVHGDASSMGLFEDAAFDVVVCVGVLPRITPFDSLRRAAEEIARVGKAYVVVVPHLLTLVDPYSQLPLWQFSPRNFRTFSRRWNQTGRGETNSSVGLKDETLFYLRARDWRSLFPGSRSISYSYMAFGLIRDLIIYRARRSS